MHVNKCFWRLLIWWTFCLLNRRSHTNALYVPNPSQLLEISSHTCTSTTDPGHSSARFATEDSQSRPTLETIPSIISRMDLSILPWISRQSQILRQNLPRETNAHFRCLNSPVIYYKMSVKITLYILAFCTAWIKRRQWWHLFLDSSLFEIKVTWQWRKSASSL